MSKRTRVRVLSRAFVVAAAIVAVLTAVAVTASSRVAPVHYLTEPEGDRYERTRTFGRTYAVSPDERYSLPAEAGWERDAVFYHIWIAAFSDSNGDGIGDIPGITRRLDYLAELGVTALFLSPFWEAMSAARGPDVHGYDITNWYRVNPQFGTRDDLDTLLIEAHRRGIRLIFDYVPNHSGSNHPWFQASASGDPDYDEWYRWEADPGPDWTGFDNQSDWHTHPARAERYYALFWHEMPDFNWRSADVRTAHGRIVRYWLNAGFDGFRVDAAPYLVEGREPADFRDHPETVAIYRAMRHELVEPYREAGYAKMMIAENWTHDTDSLARYGGSPEAPIFDLTFDFRLAGLVSGAVSRGLTASLHGHFARVRPSYEGPLRSAVFLSNHDNVADRPITALNDSLPHAALAASVQLLVPGVPFIYNGNELAMPGRAGRDVNLRQPVDWTRMTGWDDEAALHTWYRTLIALRARHAVLRTGEYRAVESPRDTYVFARLPVRDGDADATMDGEARAAIIALNLGTEPATITIPPAVLSEIEGAARGDVAGRELLWRVEIGSEETLAVDGGGVRLNVAPRGTVVIVAIP